MGACVWVRECGCVFWCLCVGACVVQACVFVGVLQRVGACVGAYMGACEWERVFLCCQVRVVVCLSACMVHLCLYVCVYVRVLLPV